MYQGRTRRTGDSRDAMWLLLLLLLLPELCLRKCACLGWRRGSEIVRLRTVESVYRTTGRWTVVPTPPRRSPCTLQRAPSHPRRRSRSALGEQAGGCYEYSRKQPYNDLITTSRTDRLHPGRFALRSRSVGLSRSRLLPHWRPFWAARRCQRAPVRPSGRPTTVGEWCSACLLASVIFEATAVIILDGPEHRPVPFGRFLDEKPNHEAVPEETRLYFTHGALDDMEVQLERSST